MKVYNINPRRLDEIMQECIAELGGNEALTEAIRIEKCKLISDIFRVKKNSGCISSQHLRDVNQDWWDTFCSYYDQDLE